MTALPALDKPNRRTIVQLLAELREWKHLDKTYQDLQKELNTLKEKLLNVPEYRALERKYNRAYSTYWKNRGEREGRVRKVRQLYLLKGITPEVLAELAKLVKEVNG